MAVDDFVMTIDDEEVVETQDEDTAPQTKRKRGDEELNPAFTFNVGSVMTHGNSVWDFTAAKDMMKKSDQGDIDEIIARKRKARAQAMVKKVMDVESDGEGVKDMDEEDEFYSANSGSDEGEEQENEDEDDDEEVIASDDEDLAVDGFGGGAASDDEEPDGEDAEEKEAMSDSGDGDEDEEDDEVDGAMSDDQSEESEEETELEKERKRAYFAPEDDQPTETHESFASMNLSRPILKGLAHVGFIQPTAIQAKTIPLALLGKDICGGAVTGSGKTAAFIVPILERLLYRPRSTAATRVLILCPTRELAIQVHSVAVKLASFTDMTFCLCVGGLSLKVQEQELKQRPDAVIATPGRLIDHIRNSSGFSTDHIEILVMDEADRMLEDGFADELGEIIKNTPKSRQTMLFSATMTDNVDSLIRMSLNRPVRLMIDKVSQASSKLVQEFVRIRQHREPDRPAVLLALVTKTFKKRTIIFFRSKAAAHQMKILFGLCGLNAAELHGNLTQEQRLDALEKFRDGNVDFLLATDLASRGLDIKGIETVINFNMPQQFAQYLHRVGRTARAGRNGRSVTLVGEADRKLLKLAVKSSPSSQIKHRLVPADLIGKFRAKVDDLTEDVKAVLQEEKEERALRQAEMEVKKSENMMEHQDEIFSRPARTWFQSEKDKKKAAKAADPSKPARDKMSGLSRAKRRRLESLKDIDAETQATQSKAIRSAKKSSLPAKLNATKNSDLVNAGLKHIREKMEKAKKRNKFKNVGFKMDLADSGKSGAVGLASKVNKQKKVSGKQGKQGKKGNKVKGRARR
ncbi:hypothetical protein BZG36_03740 [Bifiguratus adelaidae]|uniref:ATP-dependent RNA helicase DRS1 n=1 Tax=Bifiguratus adelaidae TaxID=1938954 RepID=A0A261XY45_9FUNG|nr:hypothetical protein BZG36_03740 [Bifiguratus adelaidae]